MSKRKGNAEWKERKKEHWSQNVIVDTQEWGYIDFSPQGMKEVFSGEKLSYEEYLDAQMAIGKNIRGWFFLCHHEVPLGFAGQIERITQKNICFKRIYLSGMYMDGECFNGKEDHVWMSMEEFLCGFKWWRNSSQYWRHCIRNNYFRSNYLSCALGLYRLQVSSQTFYFGHTSSIKEKRRWYTRTRAALSTV